MNARVAHAAVFAGCTWQHNGDIVQCVAAAEEPVALNETSSLGFTANEVLDSLSMEHTAAVSLRDRPQLPAVDRSFSFAFVADGTAAVEEIDDPWCGRHLVQGRSLAIPGTLSVVVDTDWLAAAGPATLRAQAPSDDSVWVYATLPDADASAAIMGPVLDLHEGCSDTDMTIVFVQNSMPDAPWSSGPVGGINSDGCGQGEYGVFQWGVVPFFD